jgi:hypothetical protein
MEKKKPPTFGNKYSSCLVASIETFTCIGSTVHIQLKSGSNLDIDFKVEGLAEKAYEKLSRSFDTQVLEDEPCNACSNKDEPVPADGQYSENTTHCDVCYSEFNGFKLEE